MLANKQIVQGSIFTPLPNDQWAREIEHWFATQLILIQSYTTVFVTGWQDGQDNWLNSQITPPKEADRWMCNSQVIQRKDYASFSVLGIGVVLGVGGSVVLLNMSITLIVNRLRIQSPCQLYKEESWKANDLLELHGMAGEAIHRRVLDRSRSTPDPAHTKEPKGIPPTVTQKVVSVPIQLEV